MALNLKNKVIIVTGGSKGIGYGITPSLANEGAIPFIIGRNETDVKKAVETIRSNGKKAVEKVVKEFGRIDGLVNNAGVNDGVGLEHGNYTDFMRSIQRNLAHYYMMAHLALPHLKVNKGAIVNIGSKTSVTGQGGTSGYAAANGGRNSLTREWAVELLPYSIRVNTVIVAECYTPLYDRWIKTFNNPEEKLGDITQKIPFENRMTTAAKIADTVVFLLSDKSSHTTGQLIYVDGGYTHLDRAL